MFGSVKVVEWDAIAATLPIESKQIIYEHELQCLLVRLPDPGHELSATIPSQQSWHYCRLQTSETGCGLPADPLLVAPNKVKHWVLVGSIAHGRCLYGRRNAASATGCRDKPAGQPASKTKQRKQQTPHTTNGNTATHETLPLVPAQRRRLLLLSEECPGVGHQY